MPQYIVDQEKFYGPLDLLLYLIEKEQLDVTEISIAALADQFVAYLAAAPEVDLDDITDFLMMATTLLHLKARLLLPRRAAAEDDSPEETDLGEQLVERVLLYRRFRLAARELASRQSGTVDRIFHRPGAAFVRDTFSYGNPERLAQMLNNLLRQTESQRRFTLPFKDIKVERKMREILQYLDIQTQDPAFTQLISALGQSRQEVAALFLSLLELVKNQEIILQQEAYLGEIVIKLRR